MVEIYTLDEAVKKLTQIKDSGFHKTGRIHDTGIGKTLESLMGIHENNFREPDLGEIELKAKRIESQSMLTLATKTPEPKGINRILYNHYHYPDAEGYPSLHSTCYGSRINPQGFKITLKNDQVVLENKDNLICYWSIQRLLKDVLTTKADKTLFVLAETQGQPKSLDEQFHFVEAYLLSKINDDKFVSAIENDKLKVDIRIGVYKSGKKKGQYHDHGTGFRMHKGHFLSLFDHYDRVL